MAFDAAGPQVAFAARRSPRSVAFDKRAFCAGVSQMAIAAGVRRGVVRRRYVSSGVRGLRSTIPSKALPVAVALLRVAPRDPSLLLTPFYVVSAFEGVAFLSSTRRRRRAAPISFHLALARMEPFQLFESDLRRCVYFPSAAMTGIDPTGADLFKPVSQAPPDKQSNESTVVEAVPRRSTSCVTASSHPDVDPARDIAAPAAPSLLLHV